MRTFRLFQMAFVAILLSVTACGGGEEANGLDPTPTPSKPEIKVDSSISTNGVSFTEEAGEKSVTFTSSEDWTLSVAETRSGTSWVTPSAQSGKKGEATVTFTVTENTEYDDRSVTVTIKAGTASISFTITQKGVDALLVTTAKYEVPQEGSTIDIEVKANIDYTMEIAEDAKGWISESTTKAMTTHKHSLTVAMNEEYDKREGEIYFISGDKKETVKVYQSGGAIILLSQNEYTVSDAGETITVELRSNCEYSVKMPDADWIVETSTRAASSHTLTYDILSNEGYDSRSAEIVYYDKNSSASDTLKIVQAQKNAIILTNKNVEVDSEGGKIEVKLNANVDFEIEMPDADWITQAETKALTEHTLYFEISQNESEEKRTAEIVFNNKDNGISDKLTVTQKGVITNSVVKEDEIWIVTKNIAGNLSELLDDDVLGVTSLKIKGPLNGTDIKCLRQMLGGEEYGALSRGQLSVLDLTDALIVEGGDSYYYDVAYGYQYTSNNEISINMFNQCYWLQSILLPKNLTLIGHAAFRGCKSLIRVSIPNNIKEISERAFYNCKELVEVYCYATTPPIIGDRCFEINDSANLYVPMGTTSQYQISNWGTFFKNISEIEE